MQLSDSGLLVMVSRKKKGRPEDIQARFSGTLQEIAILTVRIIGQIGSLERQIPALSDTEVKMDSAQKDVGGIDLNARNMSLDTAKDGQGIEFRLDPAMVAEFQKGNFTGVEGTILRIVPVQSPLLLLGLEENPPESATPQV